MYTPPYYQFKSFNFMENFDRVHYFEDLEKL